MEKVTRFGVSIDSNLLDKFDALIRKMGYGSRSEAFRDLIREKLVAEEWKAQNKEAVGVVTLVYSHDIRDLTETLNRIQHQHLTAIVSSTHIHLDHHNCLEVVVLRGKGKDIKKIADELLATRSVKHGKLIATTTGKDIE
ncbi:MAG: nickel-responsive transcriptional regulator NikR [Candidatus Aminicenantes bacterium]|nr:nickel-responsive transcriptional regulator NikR [Candidatus Aminicenantes bacterium]